MLHRAITDALFGEMCATARSVPDVNDIVDVLRGDRFDAVILLGACHVHNEDRVEL